MYLITALSLQVFQIRYSAASGDRHFSYIKVQPPSATRFIVNQLSPDTAYSFEVRAYNKLGKSKYSTAVKGATLRKSLMEDFEEVWAFSV